MIPSQQKELEDFENSLYFLLDSMAVPELRGNGESLESWLKSERIKTVITKLHEYVPPAYDPRSSIAETSLELFYRKIIAINILLGKRFVGNLRGFITGINSFPIDRGLTNEALIKITALVEEMSTEYKKIIDRAKNSQFLCDEFKEKIEEKTLLKISELDSFSDACKAMEEELECILERTSNVVVLEQARHTLGDRPRRRTSSKQGGLIIKRDEEERDATVLSYFRERGPVARPPLTESGPTHPAG